MGTKLNTSMVTAGVVSLTLLSLLMSSEDFFSFLQESIGGILIVSLFIAPLINIIATGKFEIKEKVLFIVGSLMIVMLIITEGVREAVIVILKSIVVGTLISLVMSIVIKKLAEELP